ncbi:MAG: GUN4 domain-containing protein [Cyanobacteria bacterium P01_H01_bin.35]
MARNWAICVGINNYNNMPNLQYAQRDAELMRDYFLNEAGFEKVYLFTDNSPQINDADKPFNSQPTYGTLRRFLRDRFEEEFLSPGDNFWFFYSGHGMRFNDRDYLMPADADPHPDGVEDTSISLYFVTERLRRCGADNVILFLDACRSQESSKGLGIGKEKQKGVITFFSCSPNERSYEIEDERIQQGAFTYALLESLRIQGEGNCATVERLDNRLSGRVAELNHKFKKPRQNPYVSAEPVTKSHLILLEKQANLTDVAILKNDAYQAELGKNTELARQLWIRVNIAASGSDMEAVDAISRLSNSINNLKSGDNKSFNYQGKKSPTPKVSEKNKSTPNTFKLNKLLKGIVGVGVSVIGISVMGLLINLFNNTEKETPLPEPPDINNNLNNTNITGNYSTLEDLLKQKKWKEADAETLDAMRKVSSQERRTLKNFRCSELSKIDQLWLKHSSNKFGFSVQKEIYDSLGGTEEYDQEVWIEFGDKVGWRKSGTWLRYDQLTFNINTPYRGHLPAFGHPLDWDKVVCEFCVNLFSRTKNCQL